MMKTKQDVGAVAVVELGARRKIQWAAPGVPGDPVRRTVLGHIVGIGLGVIPVEPLLIVGNAGDVPQQLVNGDAGPLGGQTIEISSDRVIQRKLARFGQHHDRHRGELLGDGGDPEAGVHGVRHPQLHIGESERSIDEHLSAFGDQHAAVQAAQGGAGAEVVMERSNPGVLGVEGGSQRDEHQGGGEMECFHDGSNIDRGRSLPRMLAPRAFVLGIEGLVLG